MTPPTKPAKKVKQITVKLEAELHQRLIQACGIQQHREGQLARILIDWALPFYEQARSVEQLHELDDVVSRQLDIERRVFAGTAKERKQKGA
jgi:hypothetical protein